MRSRSASPSTLVEPRPDPTWPRVASISGSPIRARLSRVERPTNDGGQALLDVAAVLLEMLRDEPFEKGALLGVEVAATGEVISERPGLVASPGLEARRQAGPGRSGRSGAQAVRRADYPRRRPWESSGHVSAPARSAPARYRSAARAGASRHVTDILAWTYGPRIRAGRTWATLAAFSRKPLMLCKTRGSSLWESGTTPHRKLRHAEEVAEAIISGVPWCSLPTPCLQARKPPPPRPSSAPFPATSTRPGFAARPRPPSGRCTTRFAGK